VDIAFITVNYNTLSWIKQLAEFFSNLRAPFTFSFCVVDNNSNDGSKEFLQSRPEIRYIQTGENLGYGRAINRGIAGTESKYVCVTNTDVILNREALVVLWTFLEEIPDVGVCAPRLTYADGRNQGMLCHPSLLAHYVHGFAKILASSSKRKIANAAGPVRVQGVMGAFFLIRRSVIPGPTLFDEDFFFFHEDIALAHALKKKGVKCFVIPNVSIIHAGGESRMDGLVDAFYESKYLYVRKFYGSFHARMARFVDRARIFRKRLFYALLGELFPSERMKSKWRYYEAAWKSVAEKKRKE
jgi:N-acetylglucosaminyl-diphospho-decaprenol L-rhamnosyltransferase